MKFEEFQNILNEILLNIDNCDLMDLELFKTLHKEKYGNTGKYFEFQRLHLNSNLQNLKLTFEQYPMKMSKFSMFEFLKGEKLPYKNSSSKGELFKIGFEHIAQVQKTRQVANNV